MSARSPADAGAPRPGGGPPHPLDRPVWSALAGRQQALAVGGARARRYHANVGLFAARADDSPAAWAALAALIAPGGTIGLIEPASPALPPGLAVASSGLCEQRVLIAPAFRAAAAPVVPLTEEDAPAMLELATLTRPGPFFADTHRLGGFVGIKARGRLVAMAGERMKPDGHTEVSGVCTHTDHGGRGYAATLIGAVAAAILARGETPFMHSYAANAAANALYARLDFAVRRTMMLTLVEAA